MQKFAIDLRPRDKFVFRDSLYLVTHIPEKTWQNLIVICIGSKVSGKWEKRLYPYQEFNPDAMVETVSAKEEYVVCPL